MVIAFCLFVLVSGCGATRVAVVEQASTTAATGTDGAAAASAPVLTIGLVRDPGRLGDLASAGLRRAADELGVEVRTLQTRTRAAAVRNLTLLAEQPYDLVLGIGPTTIAALTDVATTYPNVTFAAIDKSVTALPRAPTNVAGITFRTEQAGYLAGYLAGLVENRSSGSKNTIGWIGARSTPSVDRYLAGYVAGARAADPTVAVLHDYSQSFYDQAKCKELALKHVALGSDVEFQVAGRCGLGVLDAAHERNVWGIGYSADQSSLGPHVLTSAVERVDVAVVATIKAMQDGSLQGGHDLTFDVSSGGVGIGAISPRVPQDVVAKLRAQERKLAAGALPTIPTTVG
jgi:basic membrane protein A and related proteins